MVVVSESSSPCEPSRKGCKPKVCLVDVGGSAKLNFELDSFHQMMDFKLSWRLLFIAEKRALSSFLMWDIDHLSWKKLLKR